MKKLLTMMLGTAMLFSMTACGGGETPAPDSSAEVETVTPAVTPQNVEEGETSGMTLVKQDIEQKFDPAMFPISINHGKEKILPFPVAELLDEGWLLDEEGTLGAGSYTWETVLKTPTGMELEVQLENSSDKDAPYEDCNVVRVKTQADNMSGIDVSVAGIDFESTRKDVEKKFGEPSADADKDDNDYINYLNDVYKKFEVTFDKETKKAISISLQWMEG